MTEQNRFPARLAGTAAVAVAMVLAGIILYRMFGVFIPWLTWVRAGGAALAGYATSHAIPHTSAIGALVALAAGFLAALAVLVVTRELDHDDWTALRRIVRRD